MSAAAKISRVAVGNPSIAATTATYRVRSDLSQTDHIEGLPLGTRGGVLIEHNFPLDAEYTFKFGFLRTAIGAVFGGLAIDEQLEQIKSKRPNQQDGQQSIRGMSEHVAEVPVLDPLIEGCVFDVPAGTNRLERRPAAELGEYLVKHGIAQIAAALVGEHPQAIQLQHVQRVARAVRLRVRHRDAYRQ